MLPFCLFLCALIAFICFFDCSGWGWTLFLLFHFFNLLFLSRWLFCWIWFEINHASFEIRRRIYRLNQMDSLSELWLRKISKTLGLKYLLVVVWFFERLLHVPENLSFNVAKSILHMYFLVTCVDHWTDKNSSIFGHYSLVNKLLPCLLYLCLFFTVRITLLLVLDWFGSPWRIAFFGRWWVGGRSLRKSDYLSGFRLGHLVKVQER